MAFSKAKITRFNEIEGCAPPPGSYNPKLDTKLIGGVLSKTQRFLDPSEDPGSNLNLSKSSGMSSTDDVSKTPKTPKYLKPMPRSMGKPKKVSSLQDLSKLGQGSELRRLEEEVSVLQKQLHDAQMFQSRLSDWMSVVMTFAESESCPEDLQNIAKEWSQLKNDDPLADIHFELAQRKRELSEAELIIDNLRDQLGEATTNLSAMQAMAEQSEFAHKQLQQESINKSDNFDRILSQLQAHLNVVDQDKSEFQEKLYSAQVTITRLEKDLVETNNKLLESENSKVSLQEQLLQNCELLEDLQRAQADLQINLEMSKETTSSFTATTVNLDDLQADYRRLEADNCEKSDKIESLLKELEHMTETKGVLQINLASVETTATILKEKFVESEKQNEEKNSFLQEAQANVASLLTELSSANDKIKTLEDEVAEGASVVSELQEQLKAVSMLRTELQYNLDVATAQVTEINSQRLLLLTELKDLQGQVEKQACTIAALQDDKQVLQMELREASHEVFGHELERDITVDKVNYLEQQLCQLASEKDELEKELEEREEECCDLHNQFLEINMKTEEHKEELRTLTEGYLKSEEHNKRLLETVEQTQQVYQTLWDRVTKSENMIKENMNASDELGKALEQTRGYCKEATKAAERIRKELLDCQAKLKETRSKLEVSEKSREKLQRKLTGTKNVHKNTQEKLAAAELSVSELQTKLETAQKVENNLKKSLSSSDETVSQLKSKVFDYEQSLNSMIEENIINKAVLVADLDQAKGEVKQTQQLLKSSLKKENEMKIQLNNAKQDMEVACENIAQVEMKRAKLEEVYESSTTNITIIQEELMHAKEHLQEHMSQANRNISVLQEQLSLALEQNVNLQGKNLNLEMELEWANRETEWQKDAANDVLENLNSFTHVLATQVTELKEDNDTIINGIKEKMDLMMQENAAMQTVCQEAHDTILSLKTEVFNLEVAKSQVEDMLHKSKVKVSNLQDLIFDKKQEIEEMQITLVTLTSENESLQQEKKTLEEEYLKAEEEWDQREQELQLSWKLLSEEVKRSEETQLSFETKIIELETKEAEANTAIKILKDENDWAECYQLELEASLNQIVSDKERLEEELIETNNKLEIYIKNESVAQAGLDTCKEQVSKVSTMLTELREELVVLNKDFCEQDEELTELENILQLRETELATLRAREKCEAEVQVKLDEAEAKLKQMERDLDEQQLELTTLQTQQSCEAELRSKLETTETELAKQREEAEKRADEMEELLHKKMEELGNVRAHVGQLEDHTKCLDEQLAALAEAQQKAHEEKKAAEVQAHQATQALVTAKQEFSQRWSTMEDSMLNLESIEAKSRELAATDSSLRTQVNILDAEANRLRNGNQELRERLNQLEKTEARDSGHQNQAQKLSYMQHLKEIILKHQQSEEELHERLVASDCRVAQLEAQLHTRRQSLGKSMLQPTASSLAKKTPRARGKENDRSLLSTMYLSRSTSMLATSTPLHPKVFNR